MEHLLLRAATLVAALSVSFIVAACGASSPTAPPTDTPGPTDTPPLSSAGAGRDFAGKTIRLMVGYRPGGSTDLQARYFAANWPKFIPGNPKIVVSNLTPNPADRNYVWKANADGTVLSFMSSVSAGTEHVDPDAAFKSAEFTQLGSHAKRDVVWLVRGAAVPYDTLQDAKGGDVTLTLPNEIRSVEDLSGKVLAAGLLSMWLNAPLKYLAFPMDGHVDELTMIERGDVNGFIAGSQWYTLPKLRPGWFEGGYVRPIADMSHPDALPLPNEEITMPVPNAVAWMTDAQREIWHGLVLPDVLASKGLAGPPNMSDDTTRALRDAYAAALRDPEFKAGLERLQGQPAVLVDGAKMQAMVRESADAFAKQLPKYEEARQQVFDRYVR